MYREGLAQVAARALEDEPAAVTGSLGGGGRVRKTDCGDRRCGRDREGVADDGQAARVGSLDGERGRAGTLEGLEAQKAIRVDRGGAFWATVLHCPSGSPFVRVGLVLDRHTFTSPRTHFQFVRNIQDAIPPCGLPFPHGANRSSTVTHGARPRYRPGTKISHFGKALASSSIHSPLT